MDNYKHHTIVFFKRILLLFLLYFIARVFFYLLNLDYFSDMDFSALLKAFLGGFLFDFAAIAFTNAIFLLFLLPGINRNNTSVIKTEDLLFFLINALALLTNFIDARFFEFINKRSTSSIFTMMGTNQDVWLMLPRFLKDYWYIALSWTALMFVFWKYMPRMNRINLNKQKMTLKNFIYQTAVFIIITTCMLIGARGTKLKPISMIDAAGYADVKHISLVLNTPFSIIKTIENNNLKELHYYSDDELSQIYSPVHRTISSHPFRKMNVVVFILESFSKEYCGFLGGQKGFTPNLDSILSKSLVFTNAFANGKQSYEAMPAIIAGIPSLMDQPYSGSNYADNNIESLPGLLKKEGYYSAFYHGGNNGTMGFENFAHVAGFIDYKGRNEYNNDQDYDGNWGIWDEPYLQYFAWEMEKAPQPFYTTVFTLSSHHPYSIPEKYKGRFPDGNLPVLKTIAYTDFALGEFFKTASQMDWYHNTVFVFTADHTAQAAKQICNNTTRMFEIPLAMYCPSDSMLTGLNPAISQQIDIMPTLLNYLGFNKPFFSFGKDILDPESSKWAIGYVNGIYQLIQDTFVMQFDGRKVVAFYGMNAEKQAMNEKRMSSDSEPSQRFLDMEKELKAILQTYNNSLIRNRTSLNNRNTD